MGRVKLGPLAGVETVSAVVLNMHDDHDDRIKEKWKILNETDLWMEPSEINIIGGESVEIPINYEGPTDALSTF
jgi:hypothetical protein